MLLEVGTYLKD